MKLAIVIVNYNVKYFLEQALQSVKIAAYKILIEKAWETEVWVVDNNSKDSSKEMLQTHFPWVKTIFNLDNKGFSAANNQAINSTNAEYVLLLNPDTVVQENTFLDTISFMETHPDAGGLGIKMIDGTGKFLPESKRGFPSPGVAFYKIFGLSKLFPKSKVFGRYHLGFLSNKEVQKVDVLAGAFMLLRKSVLDKIGNLDETFFMYGEDIDLSYRIIKAGYQNYYFPHAPIIHYKGESTKKASVNYVFVFYNAMIIFARKHFTAQKAATFSLIIHVAVWLRALMALVFRWIKALMLPIMDMGVLFVMLVWLKTYWEGTIKYVHGGKYPEELVTLFLPLYIICWTMATFLSGGYQKPWSFKRLIRGIGLGTIIIAIVYAFLDNDYRFSRALILLGALLAVVVFSVNRILLSLMRDKKLPFAPPQSQLIAIVGGLHEAERVELLLAKARVNYKIAGYIHPDKSDDPKCIGSLNELDRIVQIYKINELVFCSPEVAYSDTIYWMEKLQDKGISFRTVPSNSTFVIGSSSKNQPGDYYSYETDFAITTSESKFNKRLFDVLGSILILLFCPVTLLFIDEKRTAFSNLIRVLRGQISIVGYSENRGGEVKLPILKKALLNASDSLNEKLDTNTMARLDFLYARDYNVYKDLTVLLKGFRFLGRKIN